MVPYFDRPTLVLVRQIDCDSEGIDIICEFNAIAYHNEVICMECGEVLVIGEDVNIVQEYYSWKPLTLGEI